MNAKSSNSSGDWVDPDEAPELTEEWFATAVWKEGDKTISKDEGEAVFCKALRGRPLSLAPKQATSLRLDSQTLAAFKSTGKGWQTRINTALNEWLAEHGDRLIP